MTNIKQANEKGGLKKKDKWFPNDSTEIEMYTAISNYHESKGMVTIAPTHRIRLSVRNTKTEEIKTPKLKETRVDTLQDLTRQFLQTLSDKNLSYSKNYLSDLIKKSVRDEQLTTLIENLDFKREIEMIYSGIQVGLDGNTYTMLQFKYKDDVSNPPKELIKVIFDDKNKVVGIQPIKLQGEIAD